jgi:hypothetical protein
VHAQHVDNYGHHTRRYSCVINPVIPCAACRFFGPWTWTPGNQSNQVPRTLRFSCREINFWRRENYFWWQEIHFLPHIWRLCGKLREICNHPGHTGFLVPRNNFLAARNAFLATRNAFLVAGKLFLAARNAFLAMCPLFMGQIRGNLLVPRPWIISCGKK